MKTKTMKITGIILTLVMLVTILGVFSLSASAAEVVVAWKDTDNDGIRDSGEATYTNLSAALSAGGIVRLTADYTLGDNATDEHYISMSSGTATLDLNGHTLTCASLIKKEIIVLSGTADLTITDSKTIGVLNCQSRSDVQLSDSAKLTIAGGNIMTVVAYARYYLSINKSGNAVFQITGGKHYSIPNEYVAANHKVTVGDSDPRYTVSAIEMSEVVAWNDTDDDGVIDSSEQVFSDMDTALAAGVDLKMNSDIFRNSKSYPPGSLKITSTKTIDLNGYSIVASAYCFEVTSGTLTIKDSAGGGQLWCQDDEKYGAITVSYGDNIGLTVESGTILGSIAHYGASRYPDAVVLSGGNYSFDPSEYIKDSTLTAGQDSSGLWGIRPAAETSCSVTIGGEYFYTGEAITPAIVVTELSGGTILTENIDYTVALTENVNVGTATATVTFINDYRGSITTTFAIGCDHSYSEHTTATNNGDGTHNFTCTVCGNIGSEQHTFTTDTCICGTQAVASLTTADATPVVTYYLTLEDAITAAQGADGSTITLLDDCMPTNLDWFQINSGIFTIDLNGKNIGSYNISTLIIYGGEITLEDSVGTGTIEHKVDLWGGHLTLKGGNYEKDVRLLDGELTVGGGNYTVITMFDGVLTLSGGTMDLLQIKDGKSTMADILLTGYHYYDANGSVVDISDLPPTLHGYDLTNVNVKKGADLSIDAVITVTHAFYTGIEQEPKVTVTVGGEELVQGTDFAVNYPNGYDFTNVGISQISIEGVGNYTGEANATYFIQKATLTAADITLNGLNASYDMNAHSASVKTLPVGLDEQYVTISYWKDGAPLADAPTDAGTHKVLVFVTDAPNYADAVLEYNLVIAPVPVTVEIAQIGAEFFYNGGSHTPQVLVTWNNGLPFYPEEFGGIVTYTDNYDVGTATATVSGNFTGSCTFEIQKGKPTITVSAPLDKVMPGYVMDITGATDAIDNFLYPTTFTVVDGEGYSVSGNTITIDEGVKIGSTITVKMVSTETKNFVAGEGSITLTVGVPMVDAPELEKDIAELEEAINDLKTEYGADVTELEAELASLKQQISDSNDEIDLIQTAITQLKEDVAEMESVFATKAELDAAIADLDAAMKQGDADLSDEIASLNTALTNAKAALEQADADNKAELVAKIETADATLDAAIKAVQKNLDDAKTELDKAIAEGDAELDSKIANLNAALESAKAALEATDSANKTELEGKIASAQTSLQAAIDQVQTNLDNAKAELDKAIADLDAAMKQGDADLSDEIANLNTALTNAKAALEQADADNKAELVAKIETADATLDAAIKAVQKNLDDAKAELDKAIAEGDAELDGKIANLNTALTNAKAALEQADADNKAELVAKIETADATLDAAIKAVQKNLDDAKAELDKAIADLDAAMKQGDADLSDEIANLNTALTNAKAALEQADADNKAELVAKIETADATLDAAIKAVQKNLDDAKAELDKAIADLDAAMKQGDADLSDEIANLNAALESAKAALEATDAANKTELEGKIASAQTSLQAAIDQVQTNLDNAKAELDKAIADLDAAMKQGDADLSDEIASLNTALTNAKAALEQADADNKAELVTKIETADATLDAAIKAVQKNLDDAKAELDKAIAEGDAELDGKIANLNAALDSAKAALEATDAANKTELEGKIASAQTSLQAAIDQVQTNLDNAKAELDKAIADLDAAMKQGDADLSDEIANLNTALTNAKAALEQADADNKAELVAKIETADATLDAAIKAVQKNLDDAKAELDKAIAEGDAELDGKITVLNEALATAKAALEAADTANKSELATKIDEAYASLDAAIKAVQKDIDDLKAALEAKDTELTSRDAELESKDAELENKDSELQTYIIIVSGISGVALCGSGALAVWFFIDKKRRI